MSIFTIAYWAKHSQFLLCFVFSYFFSIFLVYQKKKFLNWMLNFNFFLFFLQFIYFFIISFWMFSNVNFSSKFQLSTSISGLHFFAQGHGVNNDPFRGYGMVFIIAGTCILIGSLNQVFIFFTTRNFLFVSFIGFAFSSAPVFCLFNKNFSICFDF